MSAATQQIEKQTEKTADVDSLKAQVAGGSRSEKRKKTEQTRKEKNKQSIVFNKPTLTRNELKSVLESLVHDEISYGQTAITLEKEFASAFEFRKALSFSSLHSAYHLAFESLELKEGDEVILPDNAPVAALDAVGLTKASPVLVDLSRDSFHASYEDIIARINENTRAIILFYAFGAFKDYSPLYEWLGSSQNPVKKNKIRIIEDISYIAGTEFKGRVIGADSDLVINGMHEDHLITTGKGAMVMTDNTSLYSIMKDLRVQGGKKAYRVRYDYTITDYQAAMGLEQLNLLSSITERRKKIGNIYREAMKQSRLNTLFHSGELDVYAAFPVLFDTDFEHAMRYFKSLHIETRYTVPVAPLHQLLGLSGADFANTEKLYQRGLLIPIYPYLTKANVDRIVNSIKAFY